MNKKLIDIIVYTIFIAITVLLIFSFIDIFTNNINTNPTYKEWNIIVKLIEYIKIHN